MRSIVTIATFSLILFVATIANGQSARVTTLTTPLTASGGMAVGPDNNLYVADWLTDRYYDAASPVGTEIYRVFPDGNFELFASGLNAAFGIAFDATGSLFVSEFRPLGGVIRRIEPNGVISEHTIFNGGAGLAYREDGSLLVAKCIGGPAGNAIQRITPSRIATLFSNSNLYNCPGAVVFGNDGIVYVKNAFNGAILKITTDGVVSEMARVPGQGGLMAFANDRLYAVATADRRIYQITLEGEVSVLAGSGELGLADGAAAEATFNRPFGIAASVSGDTLYVNDGADLSTNNAHPNVIRMVTGVLSTLNSSVANEGSVDVPVDFVLTQNYPNPFNPSTRIRFELAQTQHVTLRIYDLFGRSVATLVNGRLSAGNHEAVFDGRSLGSGTYAYRLETGQFSETKFMTLLK